MLLILLPYQSKYLTFLCTVRSYKGDRLKTLLYLLIASAFFAGCTTSEPKPVKNSAAKKTDFAAQGIQTKRALETEQKVLLNAYR